MTLIELFRLAIRNLKYLILFPSLLVLAVFVFTLKADKEYQSQATVYTGLASGYSITDDEDSRVDYFAVNNAFDNLISTVNSRETLEETALRLLAYHLSFTAPAKASISELNFEELKEILPEDLRRKFKGNTLDETYQRLNEFRNATLNNDLVELIYAPSGNYSINQIRSNLKVARKNTSDMLDLTYVAKDPALAQHTLNILVEVFMVRFKELKNKETNNVVKYFEAQLKKDYARLKASEDKVKDFSVQNRIINYYEQTKFLTEANLESEAELEKERGKVASSNVSIKQLENQIETKNEVFQINTQLAELRKETSELQYRITNAETMRVSLEQVPDMKLKLQTLKKQIDEKVLELHKYDNSTTGLSRDKILNNWLENDLEFTESNSRIQVIDNRLKEIDNKYSQYAPLGAALARLEREVLVNEKEYLATLHGLNLAKLRKQNIELANNLSMIDAPFFPLKPLPGKRFLLLLVSALAGFVLVLGIILANYFFDNTIKSLANAKKYTKRSILAGIPDFNKLSKGVDPDLLQFNLCKQIEGSLAIRFFEYGIQAKKPKHINVFSLKDREGATFFTLSYASFLLSEGYKVAIFIPELAKYKLSGLGASMSNKGLSINFYRNDRDYLAASNTHSLSNGALKTEEYDFVIHLLHNFSNYQIPASIIDYADVNLMLLDATRMWLSSDTHILELYEKACKKDLQVVLNKVGESNLESIYGEIPKKRSAFRVLLKKVLLRN